MADSGAENTVDARSRALAAKALGASGLTHASPPRSLLADFPAASPGLPRGVASASLTLAEQPFRALWQVTAWPDGLRATGDAFAAAAGLPSAPGPGRALEGAAGTLLRVEPLRWWLVSDRPQPAPTLPRGAATLLDLSGARVRLSLEGAAAPELMARLAPVDWRADRFAPGSVATTMIHHVAVTVQRAEGGMVLFVPTSYAVSLRDHILDTGQSFGIGWG